MSAAPGKPQHRAYGDIWLGDLLWAVAQTTVGSAAQRRAWAYELLGLPYESLEPAIDPAAEPDTPFLAAHADTATDPDALRTPPGAAAAPPHLDDDRPLDYAVVSQDQRTGPGQTRAWFDAAEPLPDVTEAQLGARPVLQPLFRPETTRTLLSTALATRRDEADIDIDKIIEHASRLRPLLALPRRPLSTLRFGIQLLIDRGAGLWPFLDDQQQLHEEIVDVVGRDRVETLYFADSPLRGCGPGDRRTWQPPYQPPSAGTPAVLLTDLGLARHRHPEIGAPPDEWLRFAKLLRGAECPVLAILPYGPSRWPRRLQRAFAMLPWDRSTSVSLVRRLVGHGLEVASGA